MSKRILRRITAALIGLLLAGALVGATATAAEAQPRERRQPPRRERRLTSPARPAAVPTDSSRWAAIQHRTREAPQ